MSKGAYRKPEVLTRHQDMFQVKAPLPFPLRWVNAYLLPGPSGWTLIDPGLHTTEAEQMWEASLHELGIAFRNIDRIVLTHHHPDHYGLAGWFQERSGAPVFLSQKGIEQARLLWGEGTPMTDRMLEEFRAHGLPEELNEPMKVHMDGFVPAVTPQPEVSVLPAGERFRLGHDEYLTVSTPGHAEGHLCFYRAETKEIFCGDHVLPRISPNVGYMPGGIDENPLGSYLDSLAHIGSFEVEIAYPGHRDPFTYFRQRTEELIDHHGKRLDAMCAFAADRPVTAYQVCRAAFGEQLSLHQLRFALSETIAHLIWLREANRVSERSDGPIKVLERI